MDDPVAEIRGVVLQLTKGSRKEQQEALEHYFTKDASFKHPFCSVSNNREPVLRIFQWYVCISIRFRLETVANCQLGTRS